MLVKTGTKPFIAEAIPLCNKKLDETRKLLASEDVKNDRKQLNEAQFKFNVLNSEQHPYRELSTVNHFTVVRVQITASLQH